MGKADLDTWYFGDYHISSSQANLCQNFASTMSGDVALI